MLLCEQATVKSLLQPESNWTFVVAILTVQTLACTLFIMAILILLHTPDDMCMLYTVQVPLLISPVIMVLVMLNLTAASCLCAKIFENNSMLSCHCIILYYVATLYIKLQLYKLSIHCTYACFPTFRKYHHQEDHFDQHYVSCHHARVYKIRSNVRT